MSPAAGCAWSRPAPAKINLALVVGPTRPDGKHEVATVYQRIDLADTITLKAYGPGAAGVPVRSPVLLSEKPCGSDDLPKLH